MNNTPSSPPIVEPRFSEASFRNYEPFIARAVTLWPAETQFHQGEMVDVRGRPISPHTFVARFRDAITALKKFGYETNTVDTTKLWSITGSFTVAYGTEGSVWFRNKQLRGRPTGLTQQGRAAGLIPQKNNDSAFPSETLKLVWSSWTIDDLRALCQLITTGIAVGPVVLKGSLPADDIEKLETTYNVTITANPSDSTLIVL